MIVGRPVRIAALLVAASASVLWLLVGGRLLSMPFALATLVAFMLPATRVRRGLILGAWSTMLLITLLPFDVTARTAPDGPKFIRCCPGAPYRDYEATVLLDRAGACRFCSDVVGFNEPTWFLVW